MPIREIQERKINGNWYPLDEHGIPVLQGSYSFEAGDTITHFKIIYDAKNKTPKVIKGILDLEIRTIMNEHPGYYMVKAWRQFNEDGSITYTLQLKHRLNIGK